MRSGEGVDRIVAFIEGTGGLTPEPETAAGAQ
jgi:hypothetical protein